MGIIFLFVLVVTGAVGAGLGGVIGIGVCAYQTGKFSMLSMLFGTAAGGVVGLLFGLFLCIRAYRRYWSPPYPRDRAERPLD